MNFLKFFLSKISQSKRIPLQPVLPLFIICTVSLSTFTACGPPKKDDAQVALEGLLFSLKSNNYHQFMSKISQRTRTLIQSQLHLTDGQLDSEQALISKLRVELDWSAQANFTQSIQIINREPTYATLSFMLGNDRFQVPALYENEQWVIDLSSIKQTPSVLP